MCIRDSIIQSFRIECNAEIFRSTRDILILSILLQVLYGVVCAVCYNRYPFARKAVMQYGTVCSNAGFLGSPLAEGLFGGVGLLLTSFYLIPVSYTHLDVYKRQGLNGHAVVESDVGVAGGVTA